MDSSDTLQGPDSIDPAGLYRQIRQKISGQDFEKFASVIERFNSGNQSASDAILAIRELLDDESLTFQMSRLISDASI